MASVRTRQRDDSDLIAIDGRLVIGTSGILADAVRKSIEHGVKKIMLDLSNTSTVDSTGLGELVSAVAIARRAGASVSLAGLSDPLRDVLETTRLIDIFGIDESPADPFMTQVPALAQ
jgi:anti-sigma B factor antagonist